MKRFDELLEFIGANKKKELLKFLAINVVVIAVSVLLTILIKQIMIAFVGLILIVICNYLLVNSYFNKKKEILKDREDEFVTIIGYFQFFINNSFNVYQAFKSVIAYSSPWMEEQINSFIINFANKFTNKTANNVMLSIYQMVDEGENGLHMLQFEALFSQLSKTHISDLKDSKERSLSSLSTLPLIGAGAITVLLTFGIISVMGEMINVL